MSAKGNASRRKHGFRGPSKHDTYTVWVDFGLEPRRKDAEGGSRQARRAKVFNTVAKALRGDGARSTGRAWLTKMVGPKDATQELAVFIPGCSKALARAKKVKNALKKLKVEGKAKVFHEALYSTSSVRKCPRR